MSQALLVKVVTTAQFGVIGVMLGGDRSGFQTNMLFSER